jgi:DNA mismatch endonuclease (patch repair protein)
VSAPTLPARTDVLSPEQRSAVMARVKARDTGPERAVRRMLTDMGLRYRLHRADLPGRPDLALGPRRVAVFVHGCFWHGHDCARGRRPPKTNADYWAAKIARNRARDTRNRDDLTALGWRTLTVWECELRDAPTLRARMVRELAG